YVKEDTPEPQGLRGDVNGDEKVDIDDATMLINYLLGEPLEINQDNANCDGEEGIDIGDATALINFLLNSTWDN
ncbi:MAG: dockerin type I repeat-containing protein, partial [Muribaculaceae bacterium]|nr:dockerin type I repeat-containing protein [Muribaculaceae bacterium]MBQ7205245.1 dockerin type I repeat-containing protein [Muribaculaceae bacterium]